MDMVVCEALKYPMMIKLDSCRYYMMMVMIVMIVFWILRMMMMFMVNSWRSSTP